MKIRITFIAWFVIAIFVVSCSTVKVQSTVSQAEIHIDGSAGDWENIPLFFNQEPAVVLGAVNDTVKLNLMMRFNDPSLARMIFRRGFKIWFDKDEKFGYVFQSRNPLRRPGGERRLFNDSLRNGRFLNKGTSSSLSLRDFEVVINGALRNTNPAEIPFLNAAFGEKDGLFCFEFRAPLVNESEKGYGALITGGQKVHIRFILNKIERPVRGESRVSMMGSAGGASGMAGTMRGGGRRGGGMKGGGMSRPNPGGIEIKAVVRLAGATNQPK